LTTTEVDRSKSGWAQADQVSENGTQGRCFSPKAGGANEKRIPSLPATG